MDKASRPVRNRRYNSRQTWLPGEIQHHNRLEKRLFTPDIKRMLKDWLVRRRENPYPSRDEKKRLAINTGLTYIQICNWFANWRRKLKNVGREPARKTWGHLIKNYNTSANGNVEQFSICSGDSIWGDDDRSTFAVVSNQQQHMDGVTESYHTESDRNEKLYSDLNIPRVYSQPYLINYYDQFGVANKYSTSLENGFLAYNSTDHHTLLQTLSEPLEQCFQISSTTQSVHLCHQKSHNNSVCSSTQSTSPPAVPPSNTMPPSEPQYFPNAKYKNNIMEKYLRDCNPLPEPTVLTELTTKYSNSSPENELSGSSRSGENTQLMGGIELSKWLESAANFTPNKNNYIEWDSVARNKATHGKEAPSDSRGVDETIIMLNHEREDLEAAEVLTSLAGNYRNRMFGYCSGGLGLTKSYT